MDEPAWEMHCADVVEWLQAYDGNRFHAIFCDPPYGLSFMDKGWDSFKSGQAYQNWVARWAKLLIERALYPGAVGLFFGGPRTFHRLACGLEDAGFEIVDTIMWLYGSGMPKGLSLDKAIDARLGMLDQRKVVGRGRRGQQRKLYEKYKPEWDVTMPASLDARRWEGRNTHIKPAYEPILLVRSPRNGYSFADLAMLYGTGSLWIDGCRIPVRAGESLDGGATRGSIAWKDGWRRPWMDDAQAISDYAKQAQERVKKSERLGRWPANVILSHLSGCSEVCAPGCPVVELDRSTQRGVSRFFYATKSSIKEQNAGLPSDVRNDHPTIKPLSLTKYLARLCLIPEMEPPGRLLVPFSGSGSEMIGALQAGWKDIVGVEASLHFIEIANYRLIHYARQPRLL